MNHNLIKKLKLPIFFTILICLFALANYLVSPVWEEWGNYDSLHGFYEQPEDSIETVFLGTSLMINGVIPMELYEEYGICAQDLGTQRQPMIASYYWLKETYRLHGDSLKNVVIDLSYLRKNPGAEFFLKSIISMKLSGVKISALKEYFGNYTEALQELFPIFRYHSRWKELGNVDFTKAQIDVKEYLRGYNFDTSRYIDYEYFNEYTAKVPQYNLTDTESKSTFKKKSLKYFEKIVEFCRDNNINLILVKLPVWNSEDYNAAKELADSYGIVYLDYNFAPLIDEIDYNHALDSTDGTHLNYYGAQKFTHSIGAYLVENGYATDVRGTQGYEFMEKELQEYKARYGIIADMKQETDPAEYLRKAKTLDDTVTLISVSDDASGALTDEARDTFRELGLGKLADLKYRTSYVGAIKDGKVIAEKSKTPPESAGNKQNAKYTVSIQKTINNERYIIQSGGKNSDVVSSILIDSIEYSASGRGLNIVVYDYVEKEIVDTAVFDTAVTYNRVTDIQKELDSALGGENAALNKNSDTYKLYIYNRRCYNTRTIQETDLNAPEGLRDLIEAFRNQKDYVIVFAAKGDASAAVSATMPSPESDGKSAETNAASSETGYSDYFNSIGLSNLASLESGDSYIGMIHQGNVICDQKDHGAAPLTYNAVGYNVVSAGTDSGDTASVRINEKERLTKPQNGLNIIIYDIALDKIVKTLSR